MEAGVILRRCIRYTRRGINQCLEPRINFLASTKLWQRSSQRGQSRHFTFSSTSHQSPAVRIVEVGPRDGLQNIKTTISTAIKVDLIKRLADTGLPAIEATSFVSPKWIPQLADGAEVFDQVLSLSTRRQQENGRLDLPVLVPNVKGLLRALECGAEEVVVFASVTEEFSRKNTNCSVDEALGRCREVVDRVRGSDVRVRGVVSCIFADPYSGPTPPEQVLRVVKSLLDMGCYEVGLGDTLGIGTPKDTQNLLEVLLKEIPADKLAGHFHDTYGQAVANVVRAYDMGIRTFDSSVAGLGGCPYAKGAKGNLATEDIVYTFEKSGISTGVDLDKLASVGDWISKQLNIPNGSRAGSALFAKRDSATPVASNTQSQPPQSSIPFSSPSSASSSRNWKPIQTTETYTITRSGPAVKITLTRPRIGNPLSISMIDGLTSYLKSITRDKSIFHVLLTTTPDAKFFCTGMDLSDSPSATANQSDESAKQAYFNKLVQFFEAFNKAPQTTIAVVNGPAFGGGVGLAFACDVRLVSSKARFTLSEIKLGLSPAIISKYIVREWGVPLAREAILSGREVRPDELKAVGAISAMAASDDDGTALNVMVDEYLDRLSRCAPRSAEVCKELIRLNHTDPGGREVDLLIEQTFMEMMKPGSEGEFGIGEFRRKVRGGVDWVRFWASEKPRL